MRDAKFRMKSMLNFDISMFSGRLNWTRQPPEARNVDANAYVGSGSITATAVPGAIDLTKCATLQPITPPPMTATSNRSRSVSSVPLLEEPAARTRCRGVILGAHGRQPPARTAFRSFLVPALAARMLGAMSVYNIGAAAARSGVSAKMIRHYEEMGLIPAARRTQSGYRTYADADVHILRFIRQARDLGFSIREIGDLLSLWQNRSRRSGQVKALALAHIRNLDARIVETQAMKATLEHLVHCCHGDERPDCPILDNLADTATSASPPATVQRESAKAVRGVGKRAPARRRGVEPAR